MPREEPAERIIPTTTGESLPVVELLTGRGFITGKSGSGKSNTASVIAEELLENGYTFLVIDPEGEYYGLKEQYDLLHVGADEKCDMKAAPDQAGSLADMVLEENVPVVLDVSDYLDGEKARELIAAVVKELYQKEKDARKPCLLFVEEMQEYLPQTGGSTELAELLERIAKRGRKRGLGMLGMSQRPSSVDKDFITQCDWLVWHRLTWQNDLDVVRKILGSDRAGQVETFETGEGFLMTDWDDRTERVRFKRKRTHDAGATPGLDSYRESEEESVDGAPTGAEEHADTGEGADGGGPDESAARRRAESAEGEAGSPAGGVEPVDGEAEPADVVPADASTEPAATQPSVEPLSVESMPQPDLSELGRAELETYARRVARRNRNLTDELRAARARSDGAGVEATAAGSAEPAAKAAESTGFSPPPAPDRPASRAGVGGGLIEFSEMMIYLVRLLGYRIRVGASRVRHRLS